MKCVKILGVLQRMNIKNNIEWWKIYFHHFLYLDKKNKIYYILWTEKSIFYRNILRGGYIMSNKCIIKVSLLILLLSIIMTCIFILLLFFGNIYSNIKHDIDADFSIFDVSVVDMSEGISYNFLENDKLIVANVKDSSEKDIFVTLNTICDNLKLSKYNIEVNSINNYIILKNNNIEYPLLYLSTDKFIFDISTVDRFQNIIESEKIEDFNSELLVKTFSVFDDVIYDDGLYFIVDSFTSVNETYKMYLLPIIMESTKKPVIYLYPEDSTNIYVKVLGAEITTSYPEYKDGWNIIANPDGTLIDINNRIYNYLYWEGDSKKYVDMSSGFVVKNENIISFLEEKLSEIGLSHKESCDFISYWLPQINKYEYVLISFQMENYEETIKLEYSIEPDNELRLCVAFKGLDEYIDIPTQDLSYYNKFNRDGFYVVEWGGTLIK